MGTWGFFLGDKTAGAWRWPLTTNLCRGEEYVDLYIHSPIRLHGVVLNSLSTGTTWAFTLPSKILCIFEFPTGVWIQKVCWEQNLATFGWWRNGLRHSLTMTHPRSHSRWIIPFSFFIYLFLRCGDTESHGNYSASGLIVPQPNARWETRPLVEW
jgi:hypothetical protein